MTDTITKEKVQLVEERLQTVYDPEFPIVDIYTLGLIYGIDIDNKKKHVHLTMTFTTPSCPAAETLQEMSKNAVHEALPDHTVDIEITFEPMWTIDSVKDPDLKRMFE